MSGPKWTHGKWVRRGLTIFREGETALSIAVVTRHQPDAAALADMIASVPDLYAALEKDEARLLLIRNKLAGWNDMNGTERADFINWIWHAACETSAALARARGETT